jgi:hypothetical protein
MRGRTDVTIPLQRPPGLFRSAFPVNEFPRLCPLRRRKFFEFNQVCQCLFPCTAAHLAAGLEVSTHLRTFRPAEEPAAVVIRQLYAADPRGLSAGHPGN